MVRWRFCDRGPFEFKDKCMRRVPDVYFFLRNKSVGKGFERELDFLIACF
jgi:hypothetical protein